MDDLEELESWHEDLMAWEHYQDELERIKGENTEADLHDTENKKTSLATGNLHIIRRNNSGDDTTCQPTARFFKTK